MDTTAFRSPNAPLPAILDAGPKSRERWRVAHAVAQRLAALDYQYALTRIAKYEPEMKTMIRLRLDAQHFRRADWLGKA